MPSTEFVVKPATVDWPDERTGIAYNQYFQNLHQYAGLFNGYSSGNLYVLIDNENIAWKYLEGRVSMFGEAGEILLSRTVEEQDEGLVHLYREYLLVEAGSDGRWTPAQKVVSIWDSTWNPGDPNAKEFWASNDNADTHSRHFPLKVYPLFGE